MFVELPIAPGSIEPIAPPVTDDELRALRERNEQRAKAVIERMGARYCCHPARRVQPERHSNVLPPAGVRA